MVKIFEFNGNRQGTFIDSVSKTAMTPTNVTFKRTEKGQSSFFSKAQPTEQINTNRTLIPETGDFSIEAYINLSNAIQTGDPNFDSYPIISQKGDSFTFYAATWYGHADGNLRLYVGYEILVGTNVRGKGWKHIILTRNGNNWDLFVDNELNKSNIFSASIPSEDTLIGFSTTGSRRFKGFINKVAIYNHSLSEQERNQLYQEFLQSQITEKPIRGFEYPKPTDLSKYKEKLGENVILNGGFDSSENWGYIGDVDISGGVCKITLRNTSPNSVVYQTNNLVVGKKYRCSFDTVDLSGSPVVRLVYESGGTPGGTYTVTDNAGVNLRDLGRHEYDFIALSHTVGISIPYGSGSSYISIDNFACQEITGLLAAYNMKPNGNTLVDISGNGNNGTILSGNSSREGMVHSIGNGITVKDGALINTKNYTICGRIKLNDLMAGEGVLFSNDNDSGNDIIDAIGFRAGQLSWNYDGAGTLKNGVTTTLAVGIWYDFVFTSNGGRTGTIKAYIDGTEQTITTTVFYRSGADVRIFNRSNTNVPFIGECSDLRIYNYAFTPEQAKAYHNSWIKPEILEDWSGSAVGDTI